MSKSVFGTKEWSDHSLNCSNGCSHNCRYCYAKKMAVRYGRKTKENWNVEEVKYKKTPKLKGKVMIPTTHDITETTFDQVWFHIKNLLLAGNEILIVSKPHITEIKKLIKEIELLKNTVIDNDFNEKLLFRFSIGSTDNNVLNYWESGATSFEERLECLKFVYESSYKTSVSSEPMLSIDQDDLYIKTIPYITDSIWFGKLNNHKLNEEDAYYAGLIQKNSSKDFIINLYKRYKHDSKVKWKESIKKVVGIEIPTKTGMDI